jgi:lipopolysaccharide transport system ATP-binding protein
VREKAIMLNDVAISVNNLSKSYKLYDSPLDRLKESISPFGKNYHHDFFALNDISFNIKKGETVGIIGRNGSGKSTLLKTITGVLTPSIGSVTVNGKISALLELGAGFNPLLTGIDNIYFNGTLLGYSKDEMDAKLEDILSFADIGEFVYQPVKTYSSGMFIRLAFSVATIVDPDILIVDEALAVGDELFQRKCFARIRKLSEEGKTILFVTHSGSTIIELCNRSILLDNGELLLDGTPKLVVSHYHKLLYSKVENVSKVRTEICTINNDPEQKLKFDVDDDHEKADNPINGKQNNWEHDLLKQKPFYLDSLISQSTLKYNTSDIDITDIHIKTLSDEKVNMLVMNQEYIYSYLARFRTNVKNVSFGMCIKTSKGIELTWAEALKKRFIKQVDEGHEYLIEWHFSCFLLPGTYYTNASVKSYIDGNDVFLSRITDAQVFRVQDIPDINYGGMVHFNQFANVTRTI